MLKKTELFLGNGFPYLVCRFSTKIGVGEFLTCLKAEKECINQLCTSHIHLDLELDADSFFLHIKLS